MKTKLGRKESTGRLEAPSPGLSWSQGLHHFPTNCSSPAARVQRLEGDHNQRNPGVQDGAGAKGWTLEEGETGLAGPFPTAPIPQTKVTVPGPSSPLGPDGSPPRG